MEVKYACKHCPNVRSAHEARMKEHLLNIKICGFLPLQQQLSAQQKRCRANSSP
jgi:hypothetical protein